MDSLYHLSTDELEDIVLKRKILINKKICYYLQSMFFKKYNVHKIKTYYNINHCDDIILVKILIGKFNINISYDNDDERVNMSYFIHKQEAYISSKFIDFRTDHHILQRELVYRDCIYNKFPEELTNLIKSLYSKKNYDDILNFIEQKFKNISSTDYFARLKNIMLILCQAKYHRSKFPLPYDIVKIIAHKLMKF